MSDDRAETGRRFSRRFNRQNVVNMALIGVVLLGVAGWALVTGKEPAVVATGAVLGVVSLTAAVVAHRVLARRGDV